MSAKPFLKQTYVLNLILNVCQTHPTGMDDFEFNDLDFFPNFYNELFKCNHKKAFRNSNVNIVHFMRKPFHKRLTFPLRMSGGFTVLLLCVCFCLLKTFVAFFQNLFVAETNL